jgi:uncharacterized membrane protein YozB (DUF420 family)
MVSALPTLNAALNTLSALLLLGGYLSIRRGRVGAHRLCMVMALCSSSVFLISYLIYHARVGSVAFQGSGTIRWVYFAILISHTILAAAIVPLVLITVTRALREKYDLHRRIARKTLPLWLYVSVTGVIVYWMLYRL